MKRMKKLSKRGLTALTLLVAIGVLAMGGLMSYLMHDDVTVNTTQKDWIVKGEILTTAPTDFPTWIGTGASVIPADLSRSTNLNPGDEVIIFYAVQCDTGEGIDGATFDPQVLCVQDPDSGLNLTLRDWNGGFCPIVGETYTGGERYLFSVHIKADEWITSGTYDIDLSLGLPT